MLFQNKRRELRLAGAVMLLGLLLVERRAAADILDVSISSGGVSKITPDGKVTPIERRGANSLGIAIDRSGNIYVVDKYLGDPGNVNQIDKVTPTGAVSQFVTGFPAEGLAFDSAGNLYSASGSTIRRITPAGVVSTFAQGTFDAIDVAFDHSGNLFATNAASSVIEITPAGNVSTFATLPYSPVGLAFDSGGNLYVSGTEKNKGTITRITPDGTQSTFATNLNQPWGLAFDSSGNLYAADELALVKISPAGVVSTFANLSEQTPNFIAVQLPEPSTLGLLGAIFLLRRGPRSHTSKYFAWG